MSINIIVCVVNYINEKCDKCWFYSLAGNNALFSNKVTMRYLSKILQQPKFAGVQIKCDAIRATSFKRCMSSANGAGDGLQNHLQGNIVTPLDYADCKKVLDVHKPDGWISVNEFKQRRKSLASRIVNFFNHFSFNSQQKCAKIHRHLVIVPSSERHYMVGKIPYFYRQATDFRYLTGHLVPDAALLLDIEYEGRQVRWR